MKITKLLEDMDARSRYEAEKRDKRAAAADAVTPFQSGLLRRIAVGKLDPLVQTLNHRTHEALDGLVDLEFLDATYDLTPSGQKFVRDLSKTISADRQDAQAKATARRAMKRDVPVPTDDIADVSDEDDLDDDIDDDDAVTAGTVRVTKPKAKVNPLKSDDFGSFDKDDLKGFDDEGEYKWD